MILKRFFFIGLFIVAGISFISKAKAEEILWPYFHYPPLYQVEGLNVTGYGAHAQKMISDQMTEYTHKSIQAQPARIFGDLKNGVHYLAYGAAKTPEREEYLYYSLPCRLVFTDGVVMRPEKARPYLVDSKISLRKLLENENLIMGLSKGASYGSEIDSILKEYNGRIRQFIITGEESEGRQLKMIEAGRMDWIIWEPFALEVLKKNTGIRDELRVYEVLEKKNAFITGYIVAPKNEWGKNKIDTINRILKKLIPADAFYEGLSQWVPEALKTSFRQGYETDIIKPAAEYRLEE